jgi:hypothetical protein
MLTILKRLSLCFYYKKARQNDAGLHILTFESIYTI